MIYVELLAPGVQVYRSTAGEPLAYLFTYVWVLNDFVMALSAVFATAALISWLTRAWLGWTALFAIAAAIFTGKIYLQSVPLLELISAPNLEISPWLWLAISLAGMSLITMNLLANKDMIVRISLGVGFIAVGLGALTLVQIIAPSDLRFVYHATMIFDSALCLIATGAAWSVLICLIAPMRHPIYWGAIPIGIAAFVIIWFAGNILGRQGMPLNYIDYPNAFAFWAAIYSGARILLAALLTTLALSAAFIKTNKQEQTIP